MSISPSVSLRLVIVLCAAPLAAHATGDYSIPTWLENGGQITERSPEFFWHRELRKLAAPFKPSQTRVSSGNADGAESQADQAARLDIEDYRDAVKKGLITAPNAEAQHEAVRKFIAAANETTTEPLPEEPASEFCDYNRGAFAFHLGQKRYDEAARIWEALLNRPAKDRHYRSVWAAFMLGKLNVYSQKPEAVKWFRMARQLAKDGFADSAGLAADSYGWEAKSELDHDHLEKAAQLYLTQLALGDDSAIVSLKALVPDREPVWGNMNFGPQPADDATPETIKKIEDTRKEGIPAKLERAVRDPLLRRLTTLHILATETVHDYFDSGGDESAKQGDRCKRWLAAIEKAGISTVDDAAQVGWVAYTAGNYGEAARWLKLSNGEGAAALWLKAKLQRRDGKLKEATVTMAAALKLVREEDPMLEDYTGPRQPVCDASADMAALHLTRGDFVNALDTFVSGAMLFDAAYVAERVLTADELKSYIDQHFPASSATNTDPANAGDYNFASTRGLTMRWMLGRRLVREDRYQEARDYLPEKFRAVLDKYVAALNDGADEKLTKSRRARAWFDAAMISRYSGMELMGTEGAPDHFISGGDFDFADIADQRETATLKGFKFEGDKEVPDIKPLRIAIPVTPDEKKRLAATKPAPNKRFHYRYIAAALGWKAALLLPDQSEELADVLNASGGWIKKDDKAADKFIQAIERRASKTKVGKAASAKHWFVDNDQGPWSQPPAETN